MRHITLFLILFLASCFPLKAQEIYRPGFGVVLDYSIHNNRLIIHTTAGDFERIRENVYTPYSWFNKYFISQNIPAGETYEVENGAFVVRNDFIINHELPEYSVRFNSNQYVATYSGLYIDSVLHTEISYCSGAIRTFNDTTYVCFDGLALYDGGELITTYNGITASSFFIYGKDLGAISDIYVCGTKWYALCRNALFSISITNETIDTLLFLPDLDANASGRFLIDHSSEKNLLGFLGSNYFNLNIQENELELITQSPSTIRNIDVGTRLLITNQYGVYDVDKQGGGEINYYAKGNYHGTVQYEDAIYAFSNDGLFILNKGGAELLVPFEANIHSAQLKGNILKLGSTSGIWTFDLSSIKPHLARASFIYERILIAFALLTLIFAIYIVRQKRRQSYFSNHNATRDTIDAYIDEHIRQVTILEVCSHFKVSQSRLYEILAPIKPGELIRQKRMKIVQEGLSQNSTIESISEASGFSKEYLRKFVLPKL